jgi:hypothetical protein
MHGKGTYAWENGDIYCGHYEVTAERFFYLHVYLIEFNLQSGWEKKWIRETFSSEWRRISRRMVARPETCQYRKFFWRIEKFI